MKKIVEINLQVDASKITGKSKEEIDKFLQANVLPTLLEGLSERTRGGEAGCSIHEGGGWECHASIRF